MQIYNQSCELESSIFCCTLDHIPLVSKCGNSPPESCFFSLICSLGSFMVMLVGLLRYAQVLEHCGSSLLNTLGLAAGWTCAAGLIMVGSFQPFSFILGQPGSPPREAVLCLLSDISLGLGAGGPLPGGGNCQRLQVLEQGANIPVVDHAKVLHYIGAGVAFPASMLFLLLQSVLTYRMAESRGRYWVRHLRSVLAALAFITLIFKLGNPRNQKPDCESFVLQHLAALCEWMFIINVLVFYGTFTAEFGAISTDTFLVLLRDRRTSKSYSADSSTPNMSHVPSHLENLAMM
uniref:Uncharacterized protein n=1 Tax=Sphaerodactylus townsendi TaxID=933632 RepID=A0ACB8F7I6_9SAUR